MEADITGLTVSLILLLSCGLDLAGRKDAWRQLRWPWIAVMLGKVSGLKIVAPVNADAAHLTETVAIIALVAAFAAIGVRWIYRRYRGHPLDLSAPAS